MPYLRYHVSDFQNFYLGTGEMVTVGKWFDLKSTEQGLIPKITCFPAPSLPEEIQDRAWSKPRLAQKPKRRKIRISLG